MVPCLLQKVTESYQRVEGDPQLRRPRKKTQSEGENEDAVVRLSQRLVKGRNAGWLRRVISSLEYVIFRGGA